MRYTLILFLLFFACNKENNKKETDSKGVESKNDLKIEKKDLTGMKKKSFIDKRYKGPEGKFIDRKFEEPVYASIYTSFGTMKFELFPEIAPLAVENFVYLAKRGYYDNNEFFRVIESFVIQTGDSTNTGNGNLGYFFKTEVSYDLIHDRIGVISYANYENDHNTNCTQFFITLSSQSSLDGKHPAFGYIQSGIDVLKKIGSVDTDRYNRPLKKVFIKNIKISGI